MPGIKKSYGEFIWNLWPSPPYSAITDAISCPFELRFISTKPDEETNVIFEGVIPVGCL